MQQACKGHCKRCCFLSGTIQILVKLATEACMRRSATDEVARIIACQRNYYSVLKVRCLGSLGLIKLHLVAAI